MVFSLLALIIVGFLPSVIWLFFYLREDAHPEPNRLVLIVFALGMITAPIALGAEYTMIRLFERFSLASFLSGTQYLFVLLLGISIIEELLKFSVVKWRILADKEFDEPVDAMIYMVISALGFAAIENILFVIGPFRESVSQGVLVITSRFLGATLLHALASATVGFFIAESILHKALRHKGHIAQGLMLAIGLHTLYNWIILETHNPFFIGVILLASAVMVGHAFKDLRARVFPSLSMSFQIKTWQKNHF